MWGHVFPPTAPDSLRRSNPRCPPPEPPMWISTSSLIAAALLAFTSLSATAQCPGAAQPLFQARRLDEARSEVRAQLAADAANSAALYCMGRIAAAQGRSGE